MFEPDASWSLPAHLFLVSAWSARCRIKGDPQSCVNNIVGPVTLQRANNYNADYAWTDLTYLLHKANVNWAYYVAPGTQPDCKDDASSCAPVKQGAKTPGIWNPLPDFDTVQQDGQISNIQSLNKFYTATKNGSLPSVAWITPNQPDSEHPPALVSTGQSYVTGLMNAVMQGPDWSSSAIFLVDNHVKTIDTYSCKHCHSRRECRLPGISGKCLSSHLRMGNGEWHGRKTIMPLAEEE